ncbi:diadenylate cyclase [candidate division CSSED10-310 bacterium]|uniref:Diadenylate cyclase n=1 Tax=candidate division CSSED10-310 bacterium TaxID=2855610 RepID=A0ABV6Z1Q3_UNCC1
MNKLHSFIEVLNWRSGLDIILLGLIVYLIYRTVRSMGTWKIAVGIAIGAVIFSIASLLELPAAEWIFANASSVLVLGLIIIFQPEIRRFLERSLPFRRRWFTTESSKLGSLLIETLFMLSQRRWGAIIVIPGSDPVEQWLSGGTDADALPSIPLLLSLFDPDSPGHDGAVVLNHGRLSRYAVRLPLSKTSRLSSDYGTRHHAAMGLSEAIDALVFVVSEERGTVSFLNQGIMKKLESKEAAQDVLTKHFQKDDSQLKTDKNIRKYSIFLLEIFLSLFVATLLWTMVVLGLTETREMIFTVPIEYTPPPKHLHLTGDPPAEVKVHLSGPLSSLSSIDLSELRTIVDLSKALPGKQTLLLDGTNVQTPRSLRVIELYPSSLEIELKEVREIELLVSPQLLGKLHQGLTLTSVDVSPPLVKAFVPQEAFSNGATPKLLTTPVFLDNIYKSTTLFGKIIAPAGVQPADKRWPDVQIKISLKSDEPMINNESLKSTE